MSEWGWEEGVNGKVVRVIDLIRKVIPCARSDYGRVNRAAA